MRREGGEIRSCDFCLTEPNALTKQWIILKELADEWNTTDLCSYVCLLNYIKTNNPDCKGTININIED